MATKTQRTDNDPRLSTLSSRALLQRALRRVPDGEAYWKIVSLLHKRGDRATFEAALALCRDERPRARQVSADVLSQLGWDKDPPLPFAREAAAPLLEALEAEEEPGALSSQVAALGRCRDVRAVEPLARLKTHPDFYVRWMLTQTLEAFSDTSEEALHALIEMTRDVDEVIRDWATFSLSNTELDTSAIREALVERLDDSDAQTRVEAMYGLAERGDERVIRAALRAFEPDESGKLLFDGLCDTPGYRLLPALREMIRNEAHRRNPELLAAIRACAAYKAGL